MWRSSMLVVAVVLCLASAAPKKEYRQTTTRAPAGATDDDLWAAAIRVLTDQGYSLRDKDKDAGVVTTEWVLVDTIGLSEPLRRITHAWRVGVREGELRISIDCQTMLGSDPRTTCDDRQRVQSFAAKEPALRQAILSEAKRRAAKLKPVPLGPPPESLPVAPARAADAGPPPAP